MSTIFNLLRKINRNSPFLWEAKTDGWNYSILCDGKVAEDPDRGEPYLDITEDECGKVLEEVLHDVI